MPGFEHPEESLAGEGVAVEDCRVVRDAPASEAFAWYETESRVRALLESGPAAWNREARTLVTTLPDGSRVSLAPPLAFLPRVPPEGEAVETWLAEIPDELGLEGLLLVQAGASALGFWDDDELVRHKVIKKYVVRGRGRAQTLHLKTKGKSRYGSRLRLQNARAQLEETNEKLRSWIDEVGEPERLFVSCPVRTWPELFKSDPSLPFERDDPRIARVGLDVRVPSHEELLRVRARLYSGRISTDRPRERGER